MGYSLAAQFPTESSSERAYDRVLRELRRLNPDLSAYRFFSEPHWYVAVVGDSTDMKVFSRLARHMVTGRIIPLPEETHDALLAKRTSSTTPRPPQP